MLQVQHFLRHTQIGNVMKFIKSWFNRETRLNIADVQAWARIEFPRDVEWAMSHYENTGKLPGVGAYK
jgi:hypothetical protein